MGIYNNDNKCLLKAFCGLGTITTYFNYLI